MKEEIKNYLEQIWQESRYRVIGLFAGLFIGLAILIFGFWRTIFVLLCGSVGLYIGTRLDEGDTIFSMLERILPERFNHFR